MISFDTGKNSPVAAIRLKCLECCGGSLRDVWACENTVCPLWSWRPIRPATRRPRKGEQLTFNLDAGTGTGEGATA